MTTSTNSERARNGHRAKRAPAAMGLAAACAVALTAQPAPGGISTEPREPAPRAPVGIESSEPASRAHVAIESREPAPRAHDAPAAGDADSEHTPPAAPRAGQTFRDALRSGGQGPEMVAIPTGAFRMGCVSGLDCFDDEEPVHEVRIGRRFALGRYEVTFAQWDACAAAGGCGGHRPDDAGWGRGRRPVITVSWDDAREYAAWLSGETGEEYRLPSEAEWEYAARAGTTTKYHFGNEEGELCRWGNVADLALKAAHPQWELTFADCRDGHPYPAPVGSFGANGFRLHDMHGNVWEWTADCWNGSYAGAPSDGGAWLTGDCGRRVLRGGAWDFSARNLRAANRYGYSTGVRNVNVGFRVARTLAP